MKFICKDFWTCVFKKQIDNLRTNHQVRLNFPINFIHQATVMEMLCCQIFELNCHLWFVCRVFMCYRTTNSGYSLSSRLVNSTWNMPQRWGSVSIKFVTSIPVLQNSCTFLKLSLTMVIYQSFWKSMSLQYLALTCGLVRGGLSSLGVKSIVTAEVSVMPACKDVFFFCVTVCAPLTSLPLSHWACAEWLKWPACWWGYHSQGSLVCTRRDWIGSSPKGTQVCMSHSEGCLSSSYENLGCICNL